MAEIPAEFERRLAKLDGPTTRCEKCQGEKPPVAIYTADAPQMFEQISPKQTLQAFDAWADRFTKKAGATHISCNTKGRLRWHTRVSWQGVLKTQWVALSLAQLRFIIFVAAGLVFTAVGDMIFQSSGLLIGGYLSKVFTSLVLGAAEAAADIDDKKLLVPRYVDDVLLVSRVWCKDCLETWTMQTYPIQFLPAGAEEEKTRTDIVVSVSGNTVPTPPNRPTESGLTETARVRSTVLPVARACAGDSCSSEGQGHRYNCAAPATKNRR